MQYRLAYEGRIKGYKSWIGNVEDRDKQQDLDGHGTRAVALLLRVAPEAEISRQGLLQGNCGGPGRKRWGFPGQLHFYHVNVQHCSNFQVRQFST